MSQTCDIISTICYAGSPQKTLFYIQGDTYMRKTILALTLVLALVLSGCGSLRLASAKAPDVVYSGGDMLRDPAPNCEAYPALTGKLRDAILAQEDIALQGWDTQVVAACPDELMADPGLFWVIGYHLTGSTGSNPTCQITFRWLCDNGSAMYDEMCRKADAILSEAPADDYGKALYLYDGLERNVTYAEAEGFDQSSYAAICSGSAVCGGIADAYAFLLRRGGIEACTVMGSAIQKGETMSHAWNYAILDGAVYAFDLTWDNCDRYDTSGNEYLLHDWFAVTSDELSDTHIPSEDADKITTAANANNYFIHNGYLLTDDSADAVTAIWQQQIGNGTGVLTLRCADESVYDAARLRLFDLSEAPTLLRRLGLASGETVTVNYTTLDLLHTITIFLSPADSSL